MLVNRKTRNHIIVLVVCFSLSYFSYFNIINSFFLADDFNWIHQIKTGGAFGVWTTAPAVFFRPVVSLTLFLDYTIWGLNPIGYHLTNLSFHAGCGFFVYRILSQLLSNAQLHSKPLKMMPIMGGLLFILLPSHVEAVTWISARSDLVAACFCLGSFSFYLSYKNHLQKKHFLLSYFLFLLALLSKESVIIYPGIIFSYEIYHFFIHSHQNIVKNIILIPFAYSSLFPIYLILRYLGLGQLIGGYGTGVHLQFNSGIIIRGLSSTLRVLLPPLSTSQDYDWQLLFIMTTFALLILMLVYAWIGETYQKVSKILLFLIVAFSISLLPIINLVISVQDHQGERFLYFPSAFVVMIFTIVLGTILWQYRLILLGITTVILLLCVQALYTSNKNWQVAGQISQQIVADINSIAQSESLFIINIPDRLNGAYIYRNGLYQATQLFCEDKNIQYLPIVLFNNLIHLEDKVEVEAVAANQYEAKLMQPETYFMNPMLPVEQRLETPNFKITEFDWETRQTFRVEIKNLAFQDDIVYYSAGHLIPFTAPR